MTPADVAGVDVGGGGIRVQVHAAGRHRTSCDTTPVRRVNGSIDADALSDRIAALIRGACAGFSLPQFTTLAVGLTGMPGAFDSPGDLARRLRAVVPTRAVIVASDSLITHIGALGGSPGCVVAAGTGAIALGTDHHTIWNQSDGWGFLLGDEGGGAWIGLRGITAALRARDKRRGGSSALLHEVEDVYGSAHDVLRTISGATSPAATAAAFAPAVARAAHHGDRVAIGIWRAAGSHLADAAASAAEGLPMAFSWGGSLFRVGDLLLKPFREELLRRIPDAVLLPPRGTAVDGALTLATDGLPGDRDRLGERYARSFESATHVSSTRS